MITKKAIIAIFVASIALFNTVSYAKTITLPLEIERGQNLSIKIVTENGCQIKVIPNLGDFCSNILNLSSDYIIECGFIDLGKSYYYSFGSENICSFFLDESKKGDLYFTVSENDGIPQNSLCFMKQSGGSKSDNIVEDLFRQGLIDQQKFYININSSQQQSVIGSIELGNPNQNLIKQGQSFTQLKRKSFNPGYYAESNGNLKYGNIQLGGDDSISFSLSDPFVTISLGSFNIILNQLKSQGIYHIYQQNKDHTLLVNSIQKLRDIIVSSVAEDGSVFKIKITPQQYSKKINENYYQLLVKPSFYSSTIVIGYSAMSSYYVGFDFINQSIEIVEKAQNSTFIYE